ncbi:hypothetical protein CDD81_6796 [Ophiocordyceps australis]|uniref:Uncharacterized protein n=1 Tax=Ophiocordyceps australis TaxID=1399860 RepID=A0A2C5Y5D9_9HYPO|nr:hypothetical protein CDD81_6796 [Ophiocordyceps australis]
MSGSCPGTLFAQVGAGVKTGFSALEGAIVGGVMWAGCLENLIARRRERTGAVAKADVIHDQVGVSRTTMLLLVEAACFVVIASTMVLTPSGRIVRFTGPVGGLLIGLAQLVSLATRRSLVGVSSAYQEMGDCFCRLARNTRANTIKPGSYRGILFAAGIAAGAWMFLRLVPGGVTGPLPHVSPTMATTGGVLMAIGSRMAGGCTSGHGISGISLLSVSSMVSIASMFVSAAVVVRLVG